MAVVVGEAAVRIRPDVDGGEFRSEVEPEVAGALEEAGSSGAAKFTAAFGAALAIGGAFATSLEQAALGDKLSAQLGASGQYAEDLGSIAGDLYANAYGDSLETVNDALRGVIQSGAVMEDASNEQLSSVTASVLDLATAFDKDVGETSRAVGRMIQTGLAANAEEALDIVTRGFQQGADVGDDFLDVLSEYGTTFSELGLSGADATGLINQALAAGIPNADFAADALREMGIIGREAGEGAAEALDALGLSSEDYFAAMQAGGPEAAAALDTVLDKLRNTEDPALRAAAATELIGTQYEDLGDAILQLDPSEAESSLGKIEGAAGRMGDTLNDNASTNLTTFWRTAQTAFVDIVGGQVVPIVETVAALLATSLGPALDTVGAVVNDTVIPAVRGMAEWIGENETTVAVVAGLIAAVFVPGLVVMGTQATIARAKVVAAWVAQKAAAIASVASTSVAIVTTVAGWVAMGAQAVVSAAVVVGGWVLMGAQSLLAAGRMAAAWLIAMGPVGLVIAAVVGLVALIVANFDTIVGAIGAAWEWIKGATQAAWEWIVGIIRGAIDLLVSWFMNFTLVGLIIQHWDTIKNATVAAWDAVVGFVTGIPGRLVAGLSALGSMIAGVASGAWQWFYDTTVSRALALVGWVAGLPGMIVGAIGNLGGLLVQKGRDLIQGLVDGIAGAASYVGNVAKNIVNAVIGFVNDNVISGINNLLEFSVMGVKVNPPDIPRIPRLHSGGVFDSGTSAGEGLALLRDDELVAT